MWFFFYWFFLCQLFSPPPCPKFVNPICSRPTCSRSFVTQSPVLNGENRREGCRVPFTTNPYRIFFRYFSILFFLSIFSLVLERRMVSNIYGVMFVIPLFTCFFFFIIHRRRLFVCNAYISFFRLGRYFIFLGCSRFP